jgi:GTP-binding protein
MDGQTGLTPADQEVIRRLKQSGAKQPVFGIVNKVDAESHETMLNDFYTCGLENLITLSAEHGRGIDDLKLSLHEVLTMTENPAPEETTGVRPRVTPKIAVIGKPNAGKSTLVNALLDDQRMITSPIAGTTIDAVDSLVTIDGQEFILIDTAGIRRKSKTEQGVEVLSVVQARKALERCDVAVLLVDGEEGITDQDEKIGGLIEDVGCGLIIAINKWDTVEGRTKGLNKEYASDLVREKMAYLRYAPLLIMSALKRQGLKGMGELVDEILKQRQVRVNTREFTEWVREESEIHNPMNARFYMCHQAGRNPPTFVCHVNHPDKIDFSLKRHLIKAIREKWGYMGNPVRLHFVEGKGRAAKRPPAAR